MAILRDLKESTRLLFLYEVTSNQHTRLRTIAEALGMTVQGASDYAHGMERDGLLAIVEGEYRATKKGVEFLRARIVELRDFVERARREMAVVETTAALAGNAIRRRDRVGLFMEGGTLVAFAGRPSPSSGVAAQEASKGEDVAVRDLSGIVTLRPGRIVVARVPAIRDGGSRRLNAASSRKVLRRSRGSLVAAQDATGLAAARKLGLRPRIEFGIPGAAIEAAERGLDVLLLAPEERAAEAVQAIEVANARLEDKIPYESVGLG
jgi:putative transcriptional regulator